VGPSTQRHDVEVLQVEPGNVEEYPTITGTGSEPKRHW
jgi:hypothetical protein